MRERAIGLVVWLAAALVTAQLAIAAADLTWHLAGETAGAPAGSAVETSVVRDDRPTDLAPILALAPFGTEPPAPAPEPVEETELGLVLHGVVVSEPAIASMAFIAEAGGEIRAYGVGDAVTRDVTLEEVRRDMVLLRVGGGLETLSFPEVSQNRGVAGVLAKLPGSVSSGAETSDEPDAVIDRWRQRIAANPQTVLDDLGLAATPDGYQITDGAAPSVRRAGFRPGDLVASVNGVSVGEVEADRQLFEEIAASGQARVEVMRDGQKITMSFPLR